MDYITYPNDYAIGIVTEDVRFFNSHPEERQRLVGYRIGIDDLVGNSDGTTHGAMYAAVCDVALNRGSLA